MKGDCVVVVVAVVALCVGSTRGEGFTCPKEEGQFATLESCRIFYQCVGSHPYRQTCPEGSLYDGSKHECVSRFEDNIKCGPQPEAPPTTTPPPDPYRATPCGGKGGVAGGGGGEECTLPYCFCSHDGRAIPGGLPPRQTPQMIMITFDGAINDLNYETYQKIFLDNRTNTNGCPIRGTFFVSHHYTNYHLTEELYSQGHEMAVGSVSRRRGLEDEGEEVWTGEMVTMREILGNFAGVRREDVRGQRAPHLKPGRDAQYEVLSAYGFRWDSTIANPPTAVPVWPYSLQHTIPHECRAGTCPTRSFPGVWEVPMNSHYKDTSYDGGFCPYLDQCALASRPAPEVLDWLQADFARHYDTNRAPYMLSLTTNWFNSPSLESALHQFIDYTLTLKDVYYVTVTEAVQWVSSPVGVGEPGGGANYAPWDCQQRPLPPAPCASPTSCRLPLTPKFDNFTDTPTGTRYMVTCQLCPTVYPWVFDATGIALDKDVYDLPLNR